LLPDGNNDCPDGCGMYPPLRPDYLPTERQPHLTITPPRFIHQSDEPEPQHYCRIATLTVPPGPVGETAIATALGAPWHTAGKGGMPDERTKKPCQNAAAVPFAYDGGRVAGRTAAWS
jgi:hypothetical protein